MSTTEISAPPVGASIHSEEFAALRERMDQLDGALVRTLVDRFRLAEEVGTHKGTVGALPLDQGREAQIVRRACESARAQGVPDEGVRGVFWAVLEYCRGGVEARHRNARDDGSSEAQK